MEAVAPHSVGFLVYFCPKQGEDIKPSAAPLYPNMSQVPPPPSLGLPPYQLIWSDIRLACGQSRIVRECVCQVCYVHVRLYTLVNVGFINKQ